MKGFLSDDMRQGAFVGKVPWMTFLFLTAIFFIGQHDWFFSLNAGEGFGLMLDESTARVDQGNILRQIVFSCMGVYAVVSLVWTRYRFKVEGVLGLLVLLFLSWAILSLAWSEDPAISFRRLVLLMMLWLCSLVVSQRFSLHEFVLWVFLSTLIYSHIGLAAELILGTFHPLTGGYRFAGTLHPNSQGINCALLFFASFFLLIDQKRLRWVFIAIACESLIFLFLTKSRTSLAFSLLALPIYWFIKGPLPRKGALVLCVLFISSILLLIGDYIMPFFQHSITLGRKNAETSTLTGRIPLWGELLPYIARRPIVGYGYDGFWTSTHIAEIARGQNWVVTQGHSAYLDLSLGLGVVGAVVYILMLLVGIRRTITFHKDSGNTDYAFLGVVLIFIALNGLLESIIIIANQVSFITLMILTGLGFSSKPRARIG